MRQFVEVFIRRHDVLFAATRIRLPMAIRPVSSYKSGSADNNHVPSTTIDDTAEASAVVEEEDEVVDVRRFMHGRRNIERRDSVNEAILTERMNYQQRLSSWSSSSLPPSSSSSMSQLVKDIEALGLGTKRRRHRVYHTKPRQSNAVANSDQAKAQNTGSAGNDYLFPVSLILMSSWLVMALARQVMTTPSLPRNLSTYTNVILRCIGSADDD